MRKGWVKNSCNTVALDEPNIWGVNMKGLLVIQIINESGRERIKGLKLWLNLTKSLLCP